MHVIGLKARYVHGSGRNTKMFHLINLSEVRSTDTGSWTLLTLYSACGTRMSLTSTDDVKGSTTLALKPPKHLKPCPRCFARWEALGKPITAEQWRDNIKSLRVMTGHANRAKARGAQR
jgi:hypothetical protein